MFMALGAISTAIDALQSIASSSSSSTSSAGQSQGSASPFSLPGDGPASGAPAGAAGFNGTSRISPQTMSQLLAAQGQSSAATQVSLDPSQALQNLFSQIDSNGDGQITKGEFENALGAGGTNVAAADHVFNQLDTNGDGTVSLGELKSALQGGHHGHHHFHASASATSGSASSSYNFIEQMIQRETQAASASVPASLSVNV